MLYEAPLCICVCGNTEAKHWVQDCSAAMENPAAGRRQPGFGRRVAGVHPNAELEAAIKGKSWEIPAGYAPLGMAALGYPGETKPAQTRYDEDKVEYGSKTGHKRGDAPFYPGFPALGLEKCRKTFSLCRIIASGGGKMSFVVDISPPPSEEIEAATALAPAMAARKSRGLLGRRQDEAVEVIARIGLPLLCHGWNPRRCRHPLPCF